jgi:Undecaprenyl-phosphate galactose phosphotransferase WbaP
MSMPTFVEDSVDAAPPSTRYVRLDTVDRHAAHTLHQYCRTNTRTNRLATQLANRSNFQAFATALPILLADFLALTLCSLAAFALAGIAFGAYNSLLVRPEFYAFLALTVLPIGHLAGLYPGLGLGSILEFRQLARTLFATLIVFGGIGWFAFPGARLEFLIGWSLLAAVCLPFMMTVRFFARAVAKRLSWWGVPTLIVAEPGRGAELYRRMQCEVEQGFRPVGLLLDPDDYWTASQSANAPSAPPPTVPIYDIRRINEVAEKEGVTWVIVSPCANREVAPMLDHTLAAIPNRILLSSNALDLSIWDQMFCVGSTTGLRFGGGHPGTMKLWAKRFVDIVLTSAALVVGAPILAALCLMIRLNSRGPIFYAQKRIGLGGREFRAWKFRTMQPNADKVLDQYLATHPAAREEWDRTHKLANDPRVTSIGKILRATSIDELPQLWNVLRGEMSLVGPRPIVDSPTYDAAYVREYPDEFNAYKSVRPGLTGLWQVKCRNSGVYELRIYWDMYYIRNWCIWLDLYLILRTIKTVLMREGA